MRNQFDNLKYNEIDPSIEYSCSNHTKSSGFTLLMKYVLLHHKYGDKVIDDIKNLLKEKSEILDQENDKKWTALMIACRNSSTLSSNKIIKLLIDYGADVNHSNVKGWRPILLAATYSNTDSNIETVRLLLNAGCEINFHENNNNYSPLSLSIDKYTRSNIETVRMLLDAGADINIKANRNWTPLMYAVSNGDKDNKMVKLLVKRGCILDCKDNLEWTPLMYAARYSNSKSNFEVMKLLTEKGCNVNTMNKYGLSILMLVCITINDGSSIETAKYLIDHNADVNLKNNKDHTALTKALINFKDSSIETIQLLLDHDADLNIEIMIDEQSYTPLMLVLRYCEDKSKIDLIKLFLKYGVNVDQISKTKMTPFIIACGWCHTIYDLDTIKFLIDHSEDINKTDEHHILSAAVSSCKDNVRLIKLLLDNGVDINGKAKDGWTGIMVASGYSIKFSTSNIVKYLLKKGCDLTLKNVCGDNAIMLAIRGFIRGESHFEIIKLLLNYNAPLSGVNNENKSIFDFTEKNQKVIELLNNEKKRRKTLLYKCCVYIKKYYYRYRDYELKSLNKDIRKYLEYFRII